MSIFHIDLAAFWATLISLVTQFGFKVVGGAAIFFIARALIRFTADLIDKGLRLQKIDETLVSYAGRSVRVLLNIVLVVALLGYFGVETSSFAALLAGVGLAVGAAWSGLLANFAAGIFLVVLRPFRVGDKIRAAGTTGVVETIGLFTTTVNTSDNIQTHLANNKILGDTIVNYTANPYRRVEIDAQVANGVDLMEARALLLAALPSIPNVVANPAPVVEVMSTNLAGPVFTVRPYCHDKHYWQVYFATNMMICQMFAKAGYPVAETPYAIRAVPSQSLEGSFARIPGGAGEPPMKPVLDRVELDS